MNACSAAAIAGVRRLRLEVGEQALFDLDNEIPAGQPLELVAHIVDVARRGGQVHGQGDLACAHGLAGRGQNGEDLLVSGVLGRVLGEDRCTRLWGFGQVSKGFSRDSDMLEVARELRELFADGGGFRLDLLLMRAQAHEDRGERVGLLGHAPRQLGAAAPVSLRIMMVAAARYSRESVVRGLPS